MGPRGALLRRHAAAPPPQGPFAWHRVGNDFQLMSEHSRCVPQLGPLHGGSGSSTLGGWSPPPRPSVDTAARHWGPQISNQEPSTTQKQKAEQNGNPRKVLGAGGPAGLEAGGGEVEGQVCPCLWPGPDPHGRFPPEPPILSAGEVFIQPVLHSSSLQPGPLVGRSLSWTKNLAGPWKRGGDPASVPIGRGTCEGVGSRPGGGAPGREEAQVGGAAGCGQCRPRAGAESLRPRLPSRWGLPADPRCTVKEVARCHPLKKLPEKSLKTTGPTSAEGGRLFVRGHLPAGTRGLRPCAPGEGVTQSREVR